MNTPNGSAVSVVMRTYTEARWQWFVDAVASVQRQTVTPQEIVIIVDHNPQLHERVAQQFPELRVVENNGPTGSAGAWNACVAAALGSIIVFFDDDAVAEPTWLERLLMHYNDPQVLGVGGAILGDWLGGRPSWFPAEFDWVVGCTYRGLPTSTAPVRNLIGCNMSFRRSVFEGLSGFRESLGHVGGRPIGCDETELCIRIGQRWPDSHLVYEPRAAVHHRIPASRTTWSYFYQRCSLEGQSKALVSRLVGTNAGLATERRYVLQTLPLGMLHGLAEAVRRGQMDGVQRTWAIASGLVVTAAAYSFGRFRQLFAQPQVDEVVERQPLIMPNR